MTSTLGFRTELDRPVPALTLPAVVRTGRDPALSVVDGFVRGSGIVGRFSAGSGLIGLKVAAGGRPVRVSVTVRADAETAAWWQHRVPARYLPGDPHGPRLLLVRSQGAVRTAVLLARRPGDFALGARATATFDLSADEVPDDGLLIVELADPRPLAGLPDQLPARAALGVRIDSVTVEHRPDSAADRTPPPDTVAGNPDGVLPASGLLLVTPVAAVNGTVTWTLRATVAGAVSPDVVPPRWGPLWVTPPTGMPRLRYRDKGIAVARRRIAGLRHSATRRARRAAARTGRVLGLPARYGLYPVTAVMATRFAVPTAELVPLDGGPRRRCEVLARGLGRIEIRYTGRISGPAVLCLGTGGRSGGRRAGWRLTGSRVQSPPEMTPALGDNPAANQVELQRLLDLDQPVTIRLPADRIPLAGGLVLREDRALTGAPDGGTVLVQTEATAAPLLHVLGSNVRVEDVTLELPSAEPGPHDGDRWTALTIGRYFYPQRPSWLSRVEIRRVRVRRAGRCAANSVAVLGAVRDLTLADLDVTGGGTGLAVHWGAVGRGVEDLTGPSYHPNGLRVTGLRVRDAFEGFYLSSVYDVSVREVRCAGVEIGFRLLPGDNTDRFHEKPGNSPVCSRITVSDAQIGWCGPYALRLAGWGRSEMDRRVSRLAYRDVTVTDCTLRTEPPVLGTAARPRTAVVLERATGIMLRGLRETPQSSAATPSSVEALRDGQQVTLAELTAPGVPACTQRH